MATKQVKLMDIALARSGDKGNGSNVGVIARSPEIYAYLDKELTAAKVADHFSEIALGGVTRYDLPNLNAFNFILEESLGGGGTETLITDAQGKVHGLALLQGYTLWRTNALVRGQFPLLQYSRAWGLIHAVAFNTRACFHPMP